MLVFEEEIMSFQVIVNNVGYDKFKNFAQNRGYRNGSVVEGIGFTALLMTRNNIAERQSRGMLNVS